LRRAFGTADGRRTDGIAQQVGQLVRVVIELLCIGAVLADQLDGDRKSARHILIVREALVVAIHLIVKGAGSQYLRLQRYVDGNRLFFAHCRYLSVTLRTIILTMRADRLGGVYPTTFSALRHAAA
jgi:hypothetical protein